MQNESLNKMLETLEFEMIPTNIESLDFNISSIFVQARKQKGISKNKVKKITGLDLRTIAKLEVDWKLCNQEKVLIYAEFLEIRDLVEMEVLEHYEQRIGAEVI